MSGTTAWRILLSPPEVGDVERDLLLEAFDSNWIAPVGPALNLFEDDLCGMTGAPGAVALSSGTAALRLSLQALGVTTGDDVMVPTLTFAASAFAVSHLGARPCFVDSERTTWHMETELLAEELRRRAAVSELPAAVVGVDLYGSVADGRRLAELCGEYEIPYLSDSAEAAGAHRDGRHAGRFAAAAVLSFNGNKIVTTSGGGAVVTDSPELAERVRSMSAQARSPVPWYEHEEVGDNCRLSNLCAAVGRGQLATLPGRIEKRRSVRAAYEHRLARIPGVAFQGVPEECRPNHWLTTLTLDQEIHPGGRDAVISALHAEAIEARHGFKPMHLQPVYRGHPSVGGDVASSLFATSVSLPSGSRLTVEEISEIGDVIESALG